MTSQSLNRPYGIRQYEDVAALNHRVAAARYIGVAEDEQDDVQLSYGTILGIVWFAVGVSGCLVGIIIAGVRLAA